MRPPKALHKKARISFRLTAAQRREIERAALLESRRRGEVVEPSVLAREIVLAEVSKILERAA